MRCSSFLMCIIEVILERAFLGSGCLDMVWPRKEGRGRQLRMGIFHTVKMMNKIAPVETLIFEAAGFTG